MKFKVVFAYSHDLKRNEDKIMGVRISLQEI